MTRRTGKVKGCNGGLQEQEERTKKLVLRMGDTELRHQFESNIVSMYVMRVCLRRGKGGRKDDNDLIMGS